jgi:hypothetical protein
MIGLDVLAPTLCELPCRDRDRYLGALAADLLAFAGQERHALPIGRNDSMVADRAAGQIASQIIDHVTSFTFGRRWWLDIGDPSFCREPVDESGPVVVVLQISVLSGQLEPASGTCSCKPTQQCFAKTRGERRIIAGVKPLSFV